MINNVYYTKQKSTTFLEKAGRTAISPLYREVLVLRNLEGYSYEDIAQILDCKIGTVKSRIARGREELRKRLKDEDLI